MQPFITIAIISVILFASILIPSNDFEAVQESVLASSTEAVVVEEEPIELLPPLIPICTCESGQGTGKPQQYNIHTGEVLRGYINPDDVGACQINLYYHQDAAESMGYDLFTEEGNIRYANWLYENEGAQPWSWSNHCHKSL